MSAQNVPERDDTQPTHPAESVAAGWWIGRDEGHPWMGPFVSRDLALQVRSYVEDATKPKTYWVWEAAPTDGADHG